MRTATERASGDKVIFVSNELQSFAEIMKCGPSDMVTFPADIARLLMKLLTCVGNLNTFLHSHDLFLRQQAFRLLEFVRCLRELLFRLSKPLLCLYGSMF